MQKNPVREIKLLEILKIIIFLKSLKNPIWFSKTLLEIFKNSEESNLVF